MRFGVITQWFEPETGSGAHPTAVTRALSRLGHDVRVLTGFPNYPTGRIYPGHEQRWRVRETSAGMTVTRVPLWPTHDSSAVRRALGLTSFAASATLQTGVLRDVDVCLVYLSPATVALPATVLKKRRGTPYVLYVQDLWPDTVLQSGFIHNQAVASRVERTINRLLAYAYKEAAHLAVIAPGMRDLLTQRGVPRSKISVIPNWIDEAAFQPADPDPSLVDLLDRDSFWLMYAGGVGQLQGLETAVKAIAGLPDEPSIKLVIVGDGVALPRIKEEARFLGVEHRVAFLPPRPLGDMSAVLSAADAQLVSLRDVRLFEATIPSKLQASMACGLPVIVSAPGDAAAIVESSGGGIACQAEDPAALAAAMLRLARTPAGQRKAMGLRGRHYYETHMSESAGAKALENVLIGASFEKATSG